MGRHLKGRHLQVYRGAFFHHGIGVGRGMVVHFSGDGDKGANNRIIKTTLAEFQGNSPSVDIVPTATTSSRDEIVARALAALGSTGLGSAYCLGHNNCEHFARYCMTGRRPGMYDGQVGEAVVAMTCGGPVLALMYAAGKAGGAYCKQNGKTELMSDLAKFESAFGRFLHATPAYAQLAHYATSLPAPRINAAIPLEAVREPHPSSASLAAQMTQAAKSWNAWKWPPVRS